MRSYYDAAHPAIFSSTCVPEDLHTLFWETKLHGCKEHELCRMAELGSPASSTTSWCVTLTKSHHVSGPELSRLWNQAPLYSYHEKSMRKLIKELRFPSTLSMLNNMVWSLSSVWTSVESHFIIFLLIWYEEVIYSWRCISKMYGVNFYSYFLLFVCLLCRVILIPQQ